MPLLWGHKIDRIGGKNQYDWGQMSSCGGSATGIITYDGVKKVILSLKISENMIM